METRSRERIPDCLLGILQKASTGKKMHEKFENRAKVKATEKQPLEVVLLRFKTFIHPKRS